MLFAIVVALLAVAVGFYVRQMMAQTGETGNRGSSPPGCSVRASRRETTAVSNRSVYQTAVDPSSVRSVTGTEATTTTASTTTTSSAPATADESATAPVAPAAPADVPETPKAPEEETTQPTPNMNTARLPVTADVAVAEEPTVNVNTAVEASGREVKSPLATTATNATASEILRGQLSNLPDGTAKSPGSPATATEITGKPKKSPKVARKSAPKKSKKSVKATVGSER